MSKIFGNLNIQFSTISQLCQIPEFKSRTNVLSKGIFAEMCHQLANNAPLIAVISIPFRMIR